MRTGIHKMETNQINWLRFFHLQTHSALSFCHSSRACDYMFFFLAALLSGKIIGIDFTQLHTPFFLLLWIVFVQEIKWLHAFRCSSLSDSEFEFRWIRYRCTNFYMTFAFTIWCAGIWDCGDVQCASFSLSLFPVTIRNGCLSGCWKFMTDHNRMHENT